MEQENSMKRWWFNSMLFKKEFEHRCRLSKSTSSLGPIENASKSKDPNINDTDKNIQSWGGHDNYSNVDLFFGVKDIRNFISDETFLVKDSNGDIYSIYFDIENHIFEIDNDHPFCSELESSFYRNSSYLNNGSKKKLRQSIEIWYATSEYLRQEMTPNFRMTDPSNPVHIMSFSGARGNASQVQQSVGMRGLMSDPQVQMISKGGAMTCTYQYSDTYIYSPIRDYRIDSKLYPPLFRSWNRRSSSTSRIFRKTLFILVWM
ncbi:hypothetical protein R6Q57_018430, partial [Mikania cordata]